MLSLYPDHYFHRIWSLSPEWLKANRIKVLLLDVDNTLTTHNNPDVPNEVISWLSKVKQAGVSLFILSNNRPKRVAPFAKKLDVGYIANAAKPFAFGVRRAVKLLNADRHSLAIVGDQLFTDILCAKRAGVISILVDPMEKEPFPFFRLKRKIEQKILQNYHKRGERL